MRNSNASNRRFWRNSTSSRSLIVCRPTRHSLSLSLSLFHHKKKTHIIIKMKETNLQEESHASAQLITNTTMLNTRERSEAGVKKELKKIITGNRRYSFGQLYSKEWMRFWIGSSFVMFVTIVIIIIVMNRATTNNSLLLLPKLLHPLYCYYRVLSQLLMRANLRQHTESVPGENPHHCIWSEDFSF